MKSIDKGIGCAVAGVLVLTVFCGAAQARYMQADPMGLAAGPNLYSYAGQNPTQNIDPSGLDTYRINRDLAAVGSSARPAWDGITHTFTMTTFPDGSINHTYSWGNTANQQGWNLDQPLDLQTGTQALLNAQGEWIGGSDLDPYIAQAYGYLDDPKFRHMNLIVVKNCKWETDDLIDTAQTLKATTDLYQNFQHSLIYRMIK